MVSDAGGVEAMKKAVYNEFLVTLIPAASSQCRECAESLDSGLGCKMAQIRRLSHND